MLHSTAKFPADYRANISELNILVGVKSEYVELTKLFSVQLYDSAVPIFLPKTQG